MIKINCHWRESILLPLFEANLGLFRVGSFDHIGHVAFDRLKDSAVAVLRRRRGDGAGELRARDGSAGRRIKERNVALVVAESKRCSYADRRRSGTVKEAFVHPSLTAVLTVEGVNAARIVNLIHQTAVCHRPGHGVNLGIPDKASVLYIHTNDIALESGCAHKFLINPEAADHVNQTLYFCDALGLTDDGIKDDAAVIWVERHKPAVGLTDHAICEKARSVSAGAWP